VRRLTSRRTKPLLFLTGAVARSPASMTWATALRATYFGTADGWNGKPDATLAQFGSTMPLSNYRGTVGLAFNIAQTNGGVGCRTASVANSKVLIPGPGFSWQFEVGDLSNLCVGTYRLGAKVTINGFVNDLIDGTIAVVEGN
jgi:hypothetical protein